MTAADSSTPHASSSNANIVVDGDTGKENNKETNPNKDKHQHRRNRKKKLSNPPRKINSGSEKHSSSSSEVEVKKDEKLQELNDDPRGMDPTRRMTGKGKGRNTESFDPVSTLVRPAMRVRLGSGRDRVYPRPLKHDDVVIVPELFGDEDDWSIYYKLIEEMRELQKEGAKRSEWTSWHEGAHLVSHGPGGSKTFNMVIDRLCEYFNVNKKSAGTRFNWYKDSKDWKPFHHDSAAYNTERAKNQNITIGVSFGATRELAFLHTNELADKAKDSEDKKLRIYFPQTNNGVFTFGRDVNILWKHGINALPEDEQDGKGRISIVLWGLAKDVIEEDGSPAMLGADGKGPHAAGARRFNHRRDRNKNGRRHNGNHRNSVQSEGHDRKSSSTPLEKTT